MHLAGVVGEVVLAVLLAHDAFVVLRREDDGVNAVRRAVAVVLDGDLALGVGAEESQLAAAAQVGVLLDEAVGEVDGQRHQRVRFLAREAEHHALIAGAADVHARPRCCATGRESCR